MAVKLTNARKRGSSCKKLVLFLATASTVMIFNHACLLALVSSRTADDTTADDALIQKGPAIAFLVPNVEEDIGKTLVAIQSMDKFVQDDRKTPLLIFNEGDLTLPTKERFQNFTTREVYFPYVNWSEFPSGFDPDKNKSRFRKRSRWGYWQMCRFWIYRIWNHRILDRYSSIMRMDTDSCFTSTANAALPNLPDPQKHVYVVNKAEWPAYSVRGLFDVTQEHINKHNITPRNNVLWNRVLEWNKKGKPLPSMYNNFEITKVAFFRQPNVMAYQRAISESEPFGVFRKQWGDAPVRYLTLALFSEPDEIAYNYSTGYEHPGCLTTVLNEKQKEHQLKVQLVY